MVILKCTLNRKFECGMNWVVFKCVSWSVWGNRGKPRKTFSKDSRDSNLAPLLNTMWNMAVAPDCLAQLSWLTETISFLVL